MPHEFQIYPLFSTPLYHASVVNCISDIVVEEKDFFENQNQYNTYNSRNQNILDEDRFKEISDIVDEHVGTYAYDILKISKQTKLQRTCSWMVIGKPGSVTAPHIHRNSIFSGIFYVKSEENAGEIIFSTQPTHSIISPDLEEKNIYNSESWSISVKTNDILVFPSHLNHSVSCNNSGDIRCAIAFNYFLTGVISNQETQVLNIVSG